MPPGLNKNKTNDYITNPKENTIETPELLCNVIYDTLLEHECLDIIKYDYVLDIGCGYGNLSSIFIDTFKCVGIDYNDYSKEYPGKFIHKNFFNIIDKKELGHGNPLIICNPPWNNGEKKEDNRERFGKRKYLPEMFLRKIFTLFGENVSVILLTSYTLLMNQSIRSERWRWIRDSHFKITSILQTPLDIFPNVKMWNHVLFFNDIGVKLENLWFIPEKYFIKM